MDTKEEELLLKHGWVVLCISPFELQNQDGSFASGQAANIVFQAVKDGWYDEDQVCLPDEE
jgi:hypothetical protein